MEQIFWVINAITVGTLFLCIIYTSGVVWRVEKKLDVSYKFFLASIIFLVLGEVLDLYFAIDANASIGLIVKIARMLFALNFLGGILFMRNIVCELDGEKEKKQSIG